MKGYHWIALLALPLGLAACADMLTETPKQFLTTENYYETPQDIESATLAAYYSIQSGDVWEWNLVLLTELASDHVRIHPDEPNFGTYAPAFSPSHPRWARSSENGTASTRASSARTSCSTEHRKWNSRTPIGRRS